MKAKIFLLSLTLFLTSCSFNKAMNTEENNQITLTNNAIEPEYTNIPIYELLEENDIEIYENIDIVYADADFILFCTRKIYTEDELEHYKLSQYGEPVAHKKLYKYKYTENSIEFIFQFKENEYCVQVVPNNDQYIVLYHDTNMIYRDGNIPTYNYSLICIDDIGNSWIIEEKPASNMYRMPSIAQIEGNNYYSYSYYNGDELIEGVNLIHERDIEPLITFWDASPLLIDLKANKDSLLMFVEENNAAYFYKFNKDKTIKKYPFDANHRLYDYGILENGFIITCEDISEDTTTSFNTLTKYQSFEGNVNIEKKIEPFYLIHSNKNEGFLSVGYHWNLSYIYLDKNEIKSMDIKIPAYESKIVSIINISPTKYLLHYEPDNTIIAIEISIGK